MGDGGRGRGCSGGHENTGVKFPPPFPVCASLLAQKRPLNLDPKLGQTGGSDSGSFRALHQRCPPRQPRKSGGVAEKTV